jgi:hypothetical protein
VTNDQLTGPLLRPPDLRTSLANARSAVNEHWRQRILSGHEPTETELTVTYCEAAKSRITYVQFNPAQEGRVGADWFWWFLDSSGECFGVLVQAKKLLWRGSRWHIDFGYQSGDRQQLHKLLDAADLLDVPAAYALYCGDIEYRRGLPCGPQHVELRCPLCERASVSAISGPCAKYIVEYEQTAEDAFQRSVPFEDLVAPVDEDPKVFDLNMRTVPRDLRDFLLTPQTGAREVAKRFFAQVANMRREVFSAASSVLVPPVARRVFQVTPSDRGHFGLAYYDHVLRGLKYALPDEIRAFVRGGDIHPGGAFAGLGGIAVVHL